MTDTSEELAMVQDAATLAWAVFRRTDFDSVSGRRNLDDEFGSKIRSAAYTGSVGQFVDRLANRWGIRSLANDGDVREIVHRYDGNEGPSARRFLRTVRDNNRLVVLEMKHEFQSTNDS